MKDKQAYLQYICNKYDSTIKVAKSFKNKVGDHIWTRHSKVIDLWSTEDGLWLLKHVNHRSIMKCELIFDIEYEFKDTIFPPNHYYGFKLDQIYTALDKTGLPYKSYSTGSRGYHVHVFIRKLAYLRRRTREQLRETVIDEFGCDMQKYNDKCMIALEDAPHWKTGNLKTLIRER